VADRSRGRGDGHDQVARRLWPALALPGTLWLIALFLVPFYAVMAVAFSANINIFGEPLPAWNPLQWQFDTFSSVVSASVTGDLRSVWIRTGVYTAAALAICTVVGYPVAYYTARLAGKRRGLVLALILSPWWINYITRMLAWVNLLQDDGYVNKALGIVGVPQVSWLSGNPYTVVIALAYGYLPFFILPLFASLDRIDQRLLEASRDLGVGAVRTFLHVTLPLSRMGLVTAMVLTALPMAGDYYTNGIVSGSPNTTMVGNQVELFLLQGPQKNLGASLVLVLSLVLMFFMAYYAVLTTRASREAR
jgi:ABC-type spermidine/putrescine transport system permease subunit I